MFLKIALISYGNATFYYVIHLRYIMNKIIQNADYYFSIIYLCKFQIDYNVNF